MRLSSDNQDKDYHEVVNFIDQILLDNTVLAYCVAVDTEAGEATCFNMPLKPDKDGMLGVHTVTGKVSIVWRSISLSENKLVGSGSEGLFLWLKKDWEKREAARKLEQLQNEG